MPCPELACGGVNRFWAVREQYDTPRYRRHCARLARPIAAMLEIDLRGGVVVLIGVDGSPSLGVRLTSTGPDWRGRPDKPRADDYGIVRGRGLFVAALLDESERRGVGGVRVFAVAHDLSDYHEKRDLARVERFLDGG